MLKCRDFCKANLIAKNRIGVLDVVGQIESLMGIGANCDDTSAKVFVEMQDVTARLCVRQAIVLG